MTTTPHDALFKATFSAPERAAELLRGFLDPALVARIDWTSLVLQSGSFVDDDLTQQYADLLFAARMDDRAIRIYLLLEHQSQVDRWICLWLMRAMNRIWIAEVEADRNLACLPGILPAVVHHDDRGWSADTAFAALLDPDVHAALAAYTPNFRFALADLATVDGDTLRTGPGSSAVRMVLLALKETRRAGDLRRLLLGWATVLNELARQPDGPDAIKLVFRYLFAVRDAHEFESLDIKALGLGAASEAIMETREAYLIRRGMEEGVLRGVQQGLQQGLQQGQRSFFLDLLRTRFPRVPPAVVERVEAADAASLTRWGARLLTATELDDVFAG